MEWRLAVGIGSVIWGSLVAGPGRGSPGALVIIAGGRTGRREQLPKAVPDTLAGPRWSLGGSDQLDAADLPIPAVASLQQVRRVPFDQSFQVPDEDAPQRRGGLLRILVSTLRGFRHDLVHDPQGELISRGQAHRDGGLLGGIRGAPQDARAPLRRDDRLDGVLEREHDVTDRDGQGAARTALPGDDSDDGDPQAGHGRDGAGDRLCLASLLGRRVR